MFYACLLVQAKLCLLWCLGQNLLLSSCNFNMFAVVILLKKLVKKVYELSRPLI